MYGVPQGLISEPLIFTFDSWHCCLCWWHCTCLFLKMTWRQWFTTVWQFQLPVGMLPKSIPRQLFVACHFISTSPSCKMTDMKSKLIVLQWVSLWFWLASLCPPCVNVSRAVCSVPGRIVWMQLWANVSLLCETCSQILCSLGVVSDVYSLQKCCLYKKQTSEWVRDLKLLWGLNDGVSKAWKRHSVLRISGQKEWLLCQVCVRCSMYRLFCVHRLVWGVRWWTQMIKARLLFVLWCIRIKVQAFIPPIHFHSLVQF